MSRHTQEREGKDPMHDDQHPETLTTNNHEDHFLPKIAPITSTPIWLDLPTAREQRRYLECHCNLLNEQSETIPQISLPRKQQT